MVDTSDSESFVSGSDDKSNDGDSEYQAKGATSVLGQQRTFICNVSQT